MEAEERRQAGFSNEAPKRDSGYSRGGAGRSFKPSDRPSGEKGGRPDRGGFSRGGAGKSFKPSDKPSGEKGSRPERGGFSRSGSDRSFKPSDRPSFEGASRQERGAYSRSGADRSGFKKDFSKEGRKPFSAGPGKRPEGQEGGEKRSFGKASSRFPSPRGERSSTGPGGPKRLSPAKNRLGTQAPEQAKEFRRRGNSLPDYDEKKLAAIAGNRGRKPAGRKDRAGGKAKEKTTDEQLVRLNRFIAQSGLCSRREADDLISTGQITVNGKVMDQMGYLVNPGDVVKYGRRLLNKEKLVYVLLNKPKDFLTTTEDPEERKTVMALVENACKERIYPVGRLDRNTTGLLLLTNDGELSERLMHPSHNIRKIYQVDLDKPLTAGDEAAVRAGVELEDGKAPVDELEVLSKERDIVGLSIHIGRNRIVRRIFESLGYKVMRLDRVMYAGLTKKDLPRGTWRYLSEKEVINLKYFS
jgi:23S rRNA pseudouridine2605 synthase